MTQTPNIEIITHSESSFSIQGELTFNTINQQTINFLKTSKKLKTIFIDLQELSKIDSAGLALLIEWKKFAQMQQTELVFSHIPEQLKALAKLSYISESDLFTIKNTEHDG